MLGISSHLSALLSPYLPTRKFFVGEPSCTNLLFFLFALCGVLFFVSTPPRFLLTFVSIALRKEPFPFVLMPCSALEEPFSPKSCCLFGGLFFVRTTYEYIIPCCRRISTTTPVLQAPQAQHSTTQRSQPAQQAAKQVRADQSATTTQAKADGVGSRQHVVVQMYSSLCSQNERRNRNLLGLLMVV